MNAAIGKLKVAAAVLSFALLGYWIAALHLKLLGYRFFDAWYSQRLGNRGPWGVWLLSIGGLVMLAWGLRDLGLSDLETADFEES